MTFEEWWKSAVRPYIQEGSKIEKIVFPWVESAWRSALITNQVEENKLVTDLDLPPAYRTQANLWETKYFEARAELVKANKGIRRLVKKIGKLRACRGGSVDLH